MMELTNEETRRVLSVSRGHPRLIWLRPEQCHKRQLESMEEYRQVLTGNPFLHQVFSAYLPDPKTRNRLCAWLTARGSVPEHTLSARPPAAPALLVQSLLSD